MIKKGEQVSYEGCVLGEYEHYWLDGMLSVSVVVWDMETHEIKTIEVGYYGSDCRNMYDTVWDIDIDPNGEVARDMLRTLKQQAYKEFEKSVVDFKNKVTPGRKVIVVKGRKVPKGTVLDVFWVGEKETFKSRQYSWMYETETVAGCYDSGGNKVWIKAEYLRNITPIKSPRNKERNKFVKAYVLKHSNQYFDARKIRR